jgi:hypothetical protein
MGASSRMGLRRESKVGVQAEFIAFTVTEDNL